MEIRRYSNNSNDNDIIELLIDNFRKILNNVCDCDRVDITALQQTGFDSHGCEVTTFDLTLYVKGGATHGTTKEE